MGFSLPCVAVAGFFTQTTLRTARAAAMSRPLVVRVFNQVVGYGDALAIQVRSRF
jgi:hypothetical protein